MRLKTRPVCLPLTVSLTYNLTYFRTVLYKAEYSSSLELLATPIFYISRSDSKEPKYYYQAPVTSVLWLL
jgi:hypothetical protein